MNEEMDEAIRALMRARGAVALARMRYSLRLKNDDKRAAAAPHLGAFVEEEKKLDEAIERILDGWDAVEAAVNASTRD
jgi:hypothetical protein